MSQKKGLLINIEGIDGSGKTTQSKLVQQELKRRGYSIFHTREPTKGKIGLLLRQYLSDPSSSPFVDALLFAADRIEHYNHEIEPLLNQGTSVITDRYVASSIVYQGSQGVPFTWNKMINSQVPQPDLIIYLKISIPVALERITASSRTVIEKFEQTDALEKIERNYVTLFEGMNVIEVDGEGTTEEVTQRLVDVILPKL
ncbi:MAG: dTMP kinase [Candidatus Heimdallarchaeota archaeon]|nr:dTMP kinase [Candidatus Heimdallarchaeota archaeon]